MRRNMPVQCIATTRPEGGFADRLSAHSQIIRLERLSDAQSLELAKAAGQSTGMDDETLQAIVEKSDGVPLFVEEYALMLRENAGARDRAGRPHELRSIPLTLSGLVQNKLDRLDPHAQLVARLGATVGRVFELQLVRTLSGLARPAFEKALDTLEAADIAHRDQTRGASRTATFKHALVKDAVYAALSTLDRRRLHASVADTMLAESEDGGSMPEVLAEHLLAAGRPAEFRRRGGSKRRWPLPAKAAPPRRWLMSRVVSRRSNSCRTEETATGWSFSCARSKGRLSW